MLHEKLVRALVLLTLVSSSAASARNLYIPVAGSAPGANNTYFRTDVRLFNPSFESPVSVTLHYLPQGMNGTNIPGRIVRVEPRQVVALDDVVANFLGWQPPTVGAVRIDSNNEVDNPIIATSRTYTDAAGSTGTYGQFIPALDEQSARAKTVVLHVTQSADLVSGFRANAGIMNPGLEPVVVTPTVVSSDGSTVQGPAIAIPPMSMIQLPLSTLMGESRVIDHGVILFSSTSPVFTYASIVDNVTADQFFVSGQEDSAEVRPLP